MLEPMLEESATHDDTDSAADITGSAETAQEAPRSVSEAMASMPTARLRTLRLAKLGGIHFALWLLAMGLFAAADSWRMLSDLGLASFLAAVTGIFAGVVSANLVHEWGHYIGARRSGGAFDIPEKISLFVYDWKFESNTASQFLTMSKAGTLGGVVALLLVWWLLPFDTIARAGVLAGTAGAFVFAARVEWPVLQRVIAGGDPLTELSKIDEAVLKSSFMWAVPVGLLTLWLASP